MQTSIYQIQVITNLHAGSGDAGYGVVDKLVQRDATSNIPTIHASSIKGALREYFDKFLNKGWVSSVFGKEGTGTIASTIGEYRFLAADMLAVPIPSDNAPFYNLAYSSQFIKDIEQKLKFYCPNFAINTTGWTDISDEFKSVCDDLPIIARNHLDNGESKNLWYEQVVPHQSLFIVGIQYPDGDANYEDFNNNLHNKIIQIGGNASVGYGLCKFTKIN